MKFGLTDEQVLRSKEKFGTNQISETKSEGFWKKFRNNLGDPMIKILCVALGINVVFAALGHAEWYESIGIAAAILLAVFVSTFSEHKNENAFQKLQEEASQIFCKVYRNGVIAETPIGEIVVDDCVLLQTGDKIPADGVVVDGSLQVDQSVLNGESKEAEKIPASDVAAFAESLDFLDESKVFRGSVIVSGNAVMQVTTVGDKSVYGKIAQELQTDVERDSPLKVKLSKLAKGISKFGYLGGIAIALVFLFMNFFVHNGFDPAAISAYFADGIRVAGDVINAIMLAVIIIVMAVPEGLPLMIAIVSSLNMGKMLKDNVLVRKISGIETAGSLNILFSDKTGTITKGQLETVIFIDGAGKEYQRLDQVEDELHKLLSTSMLSNTAAVVSGEGAQRRVLGGNATERAIMNFAAEHAYHAEVQVVDTVLFNSTNKYSVARVEGEYALSLVKGAPERILHRCKTRYDQEGNKQPFCAEDQLIAKIDELANRAIRVLAFATADREIVDGELPDGEFTLVGIVGIRDEVRPESVTAIAEVHNAGVQVVMITGDRKETAVAIAKEAGLLRAETDRVLTSDELAQMPDEEIKAILPDIRVIARALPSDKSRLVRLSQECGLVVGMTGDGVNDSPALKKADVGFAMGGGTEVAKEASAIVILDDNFNSIDKAILYGRTIFNNIRKFIIFQLTINVAAVMISFAAPLLGAESPLTITQILWINLVMDTLAALAFGGEPALKRYMKEKPKRRDDNIVSPYMWSAILTASIWIFALSMVFLFAPITNNFFRSDDANRYLMTGFFVFFMFIAVFNAFNARTEQYNLLEYVKQNTAFLKVMGVIAVVQVALTYLGGVIFSCYGLTGMEWVFVLLMAVTIIPVDLVRKAVYKRVRKDKIES